MNRLNKEQVGSAIWLMAGITILLNSTTYRLGGLKAPDTGFMPFLAGAAICLFALIGLIHGTLQRRLHVGWVPILEGARSTKPLLVVVALLAYALLLSRLGFLFCTVLFIGFLFRSVRPMKWCWVISGSIFCTLAAYAIFKLWLQAQFPKGPWGF